jgi:hypothetical protein
MPPPSPYLWLSNSVYIQQSWNLQLAAKQACAAGHVMPGPIVLIDQRPCKSQAGRRRRKNGHQEPDCTLFPPRQITQFIPDAHTPGSHAQCHPAFMPTPGQVEEPDQRQACRVNRVLQGCLMTHSGQHREGCGEHEERDYHNGIVKHDQQAAEQAARVSCCYFMVA